MCGIAGIVDLKGRRSAEENARLTRGMGDALRHRGPDASGAWSAPETGVWLAHRRLAIQDLTDAGAQPMLGPRGSVITYNGEIYNTAELRETLLARGYVFKGHADTDVLLAAIDAWGMEDALGRLAGMFAFAYLDAARRTLTLVCDRLGKKPLYWAKTGDGLVFASELSPLLSHPDCPRVIDRSALGDYLRWMYIPAPGSILKGVRKVEPGHSVELDLATGETSGRTWWSVGEVALAGLKAPFEGDASEAVEETSSLLDLAVGERMVSDVPLGAFLSGGIDSSLVVAMMQATSPTPIRTFSIGSADRKYDEGEDAARVAHHLGTDHTAFVLDPDEAMRIVHRLPEIYDEPFADASQIPTHMVAKLAREHVTVAMTGDGGDEVFSGYNRHVAANGLLTRLNAYPKAARAFMSGAMTAVPADRWDALLGFLPENRRPRLLGDKLHKLAPLLKVSEGEQYGKLTEQWSEPDTVLRQPACGPRALGDPAVLASIPDAAGRMRYMDQISYLPGDILTKVDRATMAVGLEARAPLLDHRLLAFSWRLDSAVHMRGGQSKWILRQLLERHVPRAMFDRPKMGFGLPLGEWLRGPLRDWAESLLSEARLEAGELFQVAPIRQLWARHLSGAENAEHRLWAVLMLNAWQDRYRAVTSL